ncbi:MAG: MarR family winged helix-turn-helix transcriptional regulator [Candidatus Dormibacteria bacterium]
MATRTTAPTDSRSLLQEQAMEGLDRLACRQWRQGASAHMDRRGLSLHQLHLLRSLQGVGPLTVGQLAERLQVSMPSASLMLDRLEEQGLTARTRDAEDRRLVHVQLTEKGEAEVRAAAGFKREVVGRVLAHFSQGELQSLLTVLGAVERALEEVLPQPAP